MVILITTGGKRCSDLLSIRPGPNTLDRAWSDISDKVSGFV